MNWFVQPEKGRPRAGWRLLLQFVLMILFIVIGHLVIDLIATTMSFFLTSIVNMVAFTLSVWIAARFLDERPVKELGIQLSSKWFMEIGVGIGISAFVMGIIFLTGVLSGWISFTGYGWERAWSHPYPLPLLGYLIMMLMVGFYEELVFRGYQIINMVEGLTLGRISPKQAALLAVLISSIIFGFLHAGNPNASIISTASTMIAGAVLAFPYLVTGNLALSIGLHASWNFFQGGIFGFPVSGVPTRSSLFQVRETGPDLITGGSFGPEAGLMGLFGLSLIFIFCYIYLRRTNYPIRLNAVFKKEKHNRT